MIHWQLEVEFSTSHGMGSTTLILGLSNMRSVTVTGYGDNFDLIRITKPFGHTA